LHGIGEIGHVCVVKPEADREAGAGIGKVADVAVELVGRDGNAGKFQEL
jgi:hypothetical protein